MPESARSSALSVVIALVLLVGSGACQADRRNGSEDAGPRCESYGEQADALLESRQACEQDDDCTFEGLDAACFFLCYSALNVETDVPALRAEAQALGDDYVERCAGRDGFGCAIADCADPQNLRAVCVAGRCDIVTNAD